MDRTLQALLMTDYAAYTSYVHRGAWKVTKFHKFLCDVVQDFVETPSDNSFDIMILSTHRSTVRVLL